MMNSTLLQVRSKILRKGFACRNLSTVGSRPTTWAVVKAQFPHDIRPSSFAVGFGNGSNSITSLSSIEPQRRWMSDVSGKAAADALVDMLNREHTEEIENNSTESPEALKDLHHMLTEEKGWKIVTDDDSAMTKLYKTVDAVKVQLCFHCQDATERMAEHEEDMGDPDNADDAQAEDEEPASVRCTISATKGGKTLFIVCIAQDSTIRIQSTAMAGAVTDIDALHASGVNPNLYQGPEFTELAEDLQDAFHAYVEDYLGVNTDVAAYVAMQFDYKEQCQYVKFLNETKNLLA